ncbi:hypothetical protein V1478_013934 [Vespula squamosa]|uniref:Uncharacterized protein n=1 Tax=Vespula squamosa TaxID=30214 RepID=A0ABD2A6L3_VESSQ
MKLRNRVTYDDFATTRVSPVRPKTERRRRKKEKDKERWGCILARKRVLTVSLFHLRETLSGRPRRVIYRLTMPGRLVLLCTVKVYFTNMPIEYTFTEINR